MAQNARWPASLGRNENTRFHCGELARRSAAIELCRWAADHDAVLHIHDPLVKTLPKDLPAQLCATPQEAISGADALILGTNWEDYRALSAGEVASLAPHLTVIDASRFLEKTLGHDPRLRYVTVGKPL